MPRATRPRFPLLTKGVCSSWLTAEALGGINAPNIGCTGALAIGRFGSSKGPARAPVSVVLGAERIVSVDGGER